MPDRRPLPNRFLDRFCSKPQIGMIQTAVHEGSAVQGTIWHPQGFLHTPLVASGSVKISCNIWLKSPAIRVNPTIHSHNDNLHSLILAGSIVNRCVNLRPSPDGDFELCEGTYSRGFSRVRRSGKRVFQAHTSGEVVVAGDEYHVERGIFHQVYPPPRSGAVTLSAMVDPDGSRQYMLVERDQSREVIRDIPPVSAALRRKALSIMRFLLSDIAP